MGQLSGIMLMISVMRGFTSWTVIFYTVCSWQDFFNIAQCD